MNYQINTSPEARSDTQPDKGGSQVQQAENRLRKLILDMEIRPGERITERAIEALLATSRTSVRAALFHLEHEGLVTHKGRGWLVSPLSLREISQLCQYRKILELGALRQADPAVIKARLGEVEALICPVTPEAGRDEFYQAGCAFHVWIAALSENEFVIEGVENATLRLRRARWLADEHSRASLEGYSQIITALKAEEREKAARLLEAQLVENRRRVLAALEVKKDELKAKGSLISLIG